MNPCTSSLAKSHKAKRSLHFWIAGLFISLVLSPGLPAGSLVKAAERAPSADDVFRAFATEGETVTDLGLSVRADGTLLVIGRVGDTFLVVDTGAGEIADAQKAQKALEVMHWKARLAPHAGASGQSAGSGPDSEAYTTTGTQELERIYKTMKTLSGVMISGGTAARTGENIIANLSREVGPDGTLSRDVADQAALEAVGMDLAEIRRLLRRLSDNASLSDIAVQKLSSLAKKMLDLAQETAGAQVVSYASIVALQAGIDSLAEAALDLGARVDSLGKGMGDLVPILDRVQAIAGLEGLATVSGTFSRNAEWLGFPGEAISSLISKLQATGKTVREAAGEDAARMRARTDSVAERVAARSSAVEEMLQEILGSMRSAGLSPDLGVDDQAMVDEFYAAAATARGQGELAPYAALAAMNKLESLVPKITEAVRAAVEPDLHNFLVRVESARWFAAMDVSEPEKLIARARDSFISAKATGDLDRHMSSLADLAAALSSLSELEKKARLQNALTFVAGIALVLIAALWLRRARHQRAYRRRRPHRFQAVKR